MVRHTAKVTTIDIMYEKSSGTKMNDLDFCLEVVQGHDNHCSVNISRARGLKFGTRLCVGNAEWARK